jgi:hypothetical protein
MRMRILAPPTWRISIDLNKWARKLNIPLAGPQPINVAIIVGNGIPDDIVWLILGHKFNRRHVIGITKPQEMLGVNSISSIPMLVKGEKIKDLIIAIDQETSILEGIWENVERIFQERRITYKVVEEDGKLRIFDCTYASYKFRNLIVINGLDKPYSKHTIEDHLLEFYREISGENLNIILSNSDQDPKKAWRKLKDKEEYVYHQLIETSTDKLEQIFTQHIKALKALKN